MGLTLWLSVAAPTAAAASHEVTAAAAIATKNNQRARGDAVEKRLPVFSLRASKKNGAMRCAAQTQHGRSGAAVRSEPSIVE
jgi:hypothetical protein